MNENPEGTPNPLNPAPGTENEMAAGTGLNFVETEQTSEVMAEPETPAVPETPVEPEAPVAPETPAESEMSAETDIQDLSMAPEVTEFGKVEEVSVNTNPASFAKPANFTAPVSPITPAPEPEPTPIKVDMPDPMMRPVSRNNFDTLGMDDAAANNTSVEEIKEETFVRSEMPVTGTPVVDTPELVAKDSVVEPINGNGNKKVLIIGAIILILIAAICGAVALAFMMKDTADDRVTKAIDKLLNGEVSSIITAEGDVAINHNDADEFTNIRFKGTFDTRSKMNKISASVNTNTSFIGDGNLSLTIDELSNKSGEVFVRLSDMTPQPDNKEGDKVTSITTNCVDSELTNCQPQSPTSSLDMSLYNNIFDAMNNKWVEISGIFASGAENYGLLSDDLTCVANVLSNSSKYSKDIANKYKTNPFINYSTNDLGISKKQNELYKLSFDTEKMTAFINSLSSTGLINELNDCTGGDSESLVSSEIDDILSNLPTIYVEINDKYDFTRVYLENTYSNGSECKDCYLYIDDEEDSEETEDEYDDTMDITYTDFSADFDLSYPSELVIEEPDEYTTMSDLLTNTMLKTLSNS